jgi:hypothetical protein
VLVRAIIPDPAAIRIGRAMSMPRLESRPPLATGVPSASGTVLPGACAACAFAADQVAAVLVRPLASFFEGKGVNRSSGVGHIERNPTPAIIASGLAPRIPYRTETGYPWASDRLLTQGVLDTHIDTAGGADQGFAYCYREMFSFYFPRPQGGEIAAADHRIFVDDQLVGSWPQARSSPPAPAIVERDEYLWFTSYFDLTHELSRMQ